MAKLIIKRNNSFYNKFRKVKIISNNSNLYAINNDEEKRIKINEGNHHILAKIDWVKSNAIKIDIKDNYEYILFVESKKSSGKTIRLVIVLLFYTVLYLPIMNSNVIFYRILSLLFILYCVVWIIYIFYKISNSLNIRIEKLKI